ncbi:MAG: Fic family protein [Fibrobacter sp.]|nr:Fic family protein [Fibrobacter sp.]
MLNKQLDMLPPSLDLETKRVLKRLNDANRELATLKGFARAIPNQAILINALGLQEAKNSSEIECIITTNDELYRAGLFENDKVSPQAKEVKNYAEALNEGYNLIKQRKILTINNICTIQQVLEKNDADIRQQCGTTLKNALTGETVYTPPQDSIEINRLMSNLEQIINNDDSWPNIDPLIKMAVLHYQFKSIHPFYDGNGRTGRIINVLYLILKGLLDTPILYLSKYIISHKNDYYKLLQNVRENHDWESFILFILDAIVVTSQMTIITVQDINKAMHETKKIIQKEFNFYTRDLVDALFLFPYTRIQHLQNYLNISRNTATSYLNKLVSIGLLEKIHRGRNQYFVNKSLFKILSSIPTDINETTLKIITDCGNLDHNQNNS